MMSQEQNDLITRTGAKDPCGKLMRMYWQPAALVDELQGPRPVKPVKLLGEDLVAFRDADGRVGILDENCPHRGASLALGRAEGCGLRCLYHGWLVAADGRVLETPPEPETLGFRDKVCARSYPTREQGGVIWAYPGPPELEPAIA